MIDVTPTLFKPPISFQASTCRNKWIIYHEWDSIDATFEFNCNNVVIIEMQAALLSFVEKKCRNLCLLFKLYLENTIETRQEYTILMISPRKSDKDEQPNVWIVQFIESQRIFVGWRI